MNVLKPHKQTTILTLLGLRKSQRDIKRITGIDRKTIRSYQRQHVAAQSNSPGVAADPPAQIPPPWPPTLPAPTVPSTSKCEVHRACRAIDKAEGRLRALSKYARKPTRERLRDKLVTKKMFVEEELDRLARRIF